MQPPLKSWVKRTKRAEPHNQLLYVVLFFLLFNWSIILKKTIIMMLYVRVLIMKDKKKLLPMLNSSKGHDAILINALQIIPCPSNIKNAGIYSNS